MKKTLFIFLVAVSLSTSLWAEVKLDDNQEPIAPGVPSSSINVLTMNLYCLKDDWEFRLSHILSKVAEISPHVIAFQEVCIDSVSKENQIDYIKTFLIQKGYPLKKIEEQYTHRAWDKYDEYIVMVSKENVTAIDKGFLPQSLLQRGYIAFNVNDQWFINVHLEFRADNAHFRKNQIEFLSNRFMNQAHLIMGDFNSSPEDSEQQVFRQKGYNPYFPGPTQTGDDGNSRTNIDGIWFSSQFNSKLRSISGAILFKDKVQDRYLSDHFGVMSHLEFY
jgi:endonuclease/exonuclease/phosphatase family metal-dependent hydrolase